MNTEIGMVKLSVRSTGNGTITLGGVIRRGSSSSHWREVLMAHCFLCSETFLVVQSVHSTTESMRDHGPGDHNEAAYQENRWPHH